MTTDTVPKQVVVEGDGWSVGAMAKGAAMLAPSLATMLVVLTTERGGRCGDVGRLTSAATRVTFDRSTSTAAQYERHRPVARERASGVEPSADALSKAVAEACHSLALQMISDAEGASKQVTNRGRRRRERRRRTRGRAGDRSGPRS